MLQAFDGHAAYGAARAAHPRAILMDLDLPGVYGQVVLRALKRDRDTSGIAVIILTAHPEMLRDEDRAAAVVVLRKPAGLDDIALALRHALKDS